jgi:hypothetical protein
MTDLALPGGATVPLETLNRMTAAEIITTYGPEVFDLVGRLQASGLLVRDGRSHFDLELQEQAQLQIATGGDCGVADEYAAALKEKGVL